MDWTGAEPHLAPDTMRPRSPLPIPKRFSPFDQPAEAPFSRGSGVAAVFSFPLPARRGTACRPLVRWVGQALPPLQNSRNKARMFMKIKDRGRNQPPPTPPYPRRGLLCSPPRMRRGGWWWDFAALAPVAPWRETGFVVRENRGNKARMSMKTKDRRGNQPPLTPPYPRRGITPLPSSDEEGRGVVGLCGP